jgi:hypothetical protein
MWRTADGCVRLRGNLRRLLLDTVRRTLYCFIHNPEFPFDNPDALIGFGFSAPGTFENLDHRERVYAVASVARSLVCSRRTPRRKQWKDRAVHDIFANFLAEIESEIEFCEEFIEFRAHEHSHRFRKLCAKAHWETGGNAEPLEDDPARWKTRVDEIVGYLVPHRHFLHDRMFADSDPETARKLRRENGLPDDYFTGTIPAVTDEMLGRCRRFLLEAGRRLETT